MLFTRLFVVNAAERRGIRIDRRRHARIGVPVTLCTLAVVAASLWLVSQGLGVQDPLSCG